MTTTVGASTVSSPITYEAEEYQKGGLNAPRNVENLIDEYSLKYEVSASVMRNVIMCESSFNPNAVGDGGNSFGLVQIHLPSWPSVSREQALDPEFAVEFLAKNLAIHNGKIWTCYRMLYS